MNVQELSHVHGLLLEIRRSLEADGTVPAGAFADYDAQPIRPHHIHRQKADHERAVTLLLDGIEATLETYPPEPRITQRH